MKWIMILISHNTRAKVFPVNLPRVILQAGVTFGVNNKQELLLDVVWSNIMVFTESLWRESPTGKMV